MGTVRRFTDRQKARGALRRRMGDPQTRTVAILGSCLLLAGIAFYALVRPPATSAIGSPVATVQTNWGPLSDEDRQLLAKVKQAGLWEMPTGQQAQTKAARQSIKDVGRKLNAEHMLLDQDVVSVADKLGVTLPTNPNPQQQGFMNELAGLSGEAYDRDFVLRLRTAHGKVFSVIATVRSDTGNSLIREFASRAMVFVQRHMGYLESTGLVDYTQRLPPS
jgi:putative membrane protein